MSRRWLVLTGSIATACGLSVTGLEPINGDAGIGVSQSTGADSGTDASSQNEEAGSFIDPVEAGARDDASPDSGVDGGAGGWCSTQPTHRLCFDFDDGKLGALQVDHTGGANCTVAGKALACKSPDTSVASVVVKKWNPKPKTIDLAFDLTITAAGYTQVGGVTASNPYYEMLISQDTNLLYIEYPASGFAKTISTTLSGTHRIRMQVDFVTNHVTVSEGGTVKHDASIQNSLATSTSAQALVGIYDSDRGRTVTVDNVTIDWTD